MAVLTNKSIASTYKSVLSIGATTESALTTSIQQLTDGLGNSSPLSMSTTQIQFNNNANTFSFPADRGTSGQILKLADANGTLSWADDDLSNTLNFSGGTGTGSVTLDTQTLAFTGTANEIVTSASSQAITLSFPTAGVTLPNGSVATTQSANDNSTKVATTAYVKSVVTAEDLDTIGDSGTGSIDLDSQSFSVLGTVNEITTVAANQSITLSFPTAGVTLPDGSVATTQTASDDSTKVATTEYVTDAIGSISFDVTKTGTITENQIAVWNDSTDELRSDETLTIGTDHSITLLQKNSVDANLNSININGGNVAVTTGTRNTGFGYENLNAITSGGNNTAIGYGTLKVLAFGSSNTAIGMNALNKATGSNNVAIGAYAGQDVLANGSNTVIGYQSYEFGTSQSSVAIGYQSLRGGSATNIGQGNTAIGYQSLSGITNGFQNIAIGYQSGSAMSSGDKNVIIGSFSGVAGSFDIRASDNNIILSDGGGNIRQWMDADGKLQLPDYGSGTHTGTLAKSLGVDTSGNVIEFTSGAGTGTVAGTGTAGTITKWATGGADIEDSIITESGGNVGIAKSPSTFRLELETTSGGNGLKITRGTADFQVFQVTNGASYVGTGNADTLHLITGGSSKMSISSTGAATFSSSVTSGGTITNQLSSGDAIVYAKNGTVTTMMIANSTAENIGIAGTESAHDYVIRTANTEKMRITSGGAATFSTGADRTLIIGNDSDDTGYNVVSLNGTTTKGSYSGIAGGGSNDENLYLNSADGVVVQTKVGASFTRKLTILNGGNVGIGIDSPSVRLDVGGASNSDSTARFAKTSEGTLLLGGNRSTSNCPFIGSENNFDFAFITNNTEKMRITSGGTVVVGAAVDSAALSSFVSGFNGVGAKVSNNDYFNFTGLNASDSRTFYVLGTGAIHSTSTSITQITSDVNLKTEITDYTKGLSEVLLMKPRYYKYKSNLEELKVGFIAQEMEEALSGSMIDSSEINKTTGEKYKTYQLEWYPLLVKAIQEQQTIIEDLKARIETLEG